MRTSAQLKSRPAATVVLKRGKGVSGADARQRLLPSALLLSQPNTAMVCHHLPLPHLHNYKHRNAGSNVHTLRTSSAPSACCSVRSSRVMSVSMICEAGGYLLDDAYTHYTRPIAAQTHVLHGHPCCCTDRTPLAGACRKSGASPRCCWDTAKRITAAAEPLGL